MRRNIEVDSPILALRAASTTLDPESRASRIAARRRLSGRGGAPEDVPQRPEMLGSADKGAGRAELARQAEPVRRWLTGYFRRRLNDDSDVEDMVQDVFARIVTRDSVEPIKNLGGYILKIASSVIADRSRRRAVRLADAHVPFDPDLHAGEEIDPERVLGGKEDLNAAVAALLSLPERTRTVFVLRRLEGYSYRDIAAHLGISVSAVEKHLVRALQHLSAEREKHFDS